MMFYNQDHSINELKYESHYIHSYLIYIMHTYMVKWIKDQVVRELSSYHEIKYKKNYYIDSR